MLIEHVLTALIHLLNMHRCIPDVIVIHVSKTDFSWESNKQQRCNVVEMTARVRKLLKSMDTHSIGCRAVFYPHMASLPWCVHWNKQRATCRARARLNGAIANVPKTAGHMLYFTRQFKWCKVKASTIFIASGLYQSWGTLFS